MESITTNTNKLLTPLQKSFLIIQQLESKLNRLENASQEPLAIVGMSCRFPGGANDIESFWQLLRNGVDAISEVPKERWNINDYYDSDSQTPGKISTPYGGFLDRVDAFDASFFGISPREAACMDPQQRLLLEVSWEALEKAHIVPQKLFNSLTGVFIGIGGIDYSRQLIQAGTLDAFVGTGTAQNAAAGRLSYFLGLTGPSIAIDTACSSSLTSVHLACQSLRQWECNLAIAGGINLLLSPEMSVVFSKARMLSLDGRCKTFDAAANGYVRAEGCGIIVLKRLSDAVAAQDNILALIRGSAVNQDGPSGGLTVPNGPSQEAVIRQALKSGGVDPAQVSYIEAHGTGTSLGDPIEVGALGAVFGDTHSKQKPLMIGSVKTNIGHTECAAGIAGAIKVVLQMQKQQIVSHLHLGEPNPYIEWQKLPVIVPTHTTPWTIDGGRRFAGVSSFGFSGTNAHVVLEEASHLKRPEAQASPPPASLLTISAKTKEALQAYANSYQIYLQSDLELPMADICYSARTGRSHFDYRLAIVATSSAELVEKLAKFTANYEVAGVFSEHLASSVMQPKVAFLFTGQGSQYVGMGQQLYQTQPVFRETLDRCDAFLQSYLEIPLLKILYPDRQQTSPIDETTYTPLALFAIEYALYQQWKAWGIKPNVVIGHSVGEYVAACVAGVFSLEDALKLLFERGRLIRSLPPDGKMVAIAASQEDIQPLLVKHAEFVSIAAINGPRNIVISGKSSKIEIIITTLENKGISTKKLRVSQAFHSPLVEPILSQFNAVAQTINYAPPQIPIVSNITGKLVTAEIATPDYWCQHLRQPVQFVAGIQTLQQQEVKAFLEIGPKLTLLNMGRRCFSEDFGIWLASLTPELQDWEQMLYSLGQLYTNGFSVNWLEFDRPYPGNRVEIPTYPFQRQRYWFSDPGLQIISETLPTHSSSQPIPRQGSNLHIFKPTWQKSQSIADSGQSFYEQIHKKILIFVPHESWIEILQKQFRKHISNWIFVKPGATDLPRQGQIYTLDPEDSQASKRLLNHLDSHGFQATQIILLWNFDRSCESLDKLEKCIKQSKLYGLNTLYYLTQSLIKQGRPNQPITISYGFRSTNETAQPDQTCGVGLALSAISEASWLRYRFIQIQQECLNISEFIKIALTESALEGSIAEIRYINQHRWIRQITPYNYQQAQLGQLIPLSEGGVVLITGGAGGIGLIVATSLARQYQARLILTGRSPLSDLIQSRLANIEKAGGKADYFQADTTDETQMRACVTYAKQRWGQLDGVIHATGIFGQGSRLVDMDRDELEQITLAKIEGSLIVDRVTQNEPLSFFILFSSLSSCLSTANSAAYATANRFLDDFADLREQHRLRGQRHGQTLAINWPYWQEGGMQIASEREVLITQATGIESLSTELGLQALWVSMMLAKQDKLSQLIIAPGNYERVETTLTRPMQPNYNLATNMPTNSQPLSDDFEQLQVTLLPSVIGDLSQMVIKTLRLRRNVLEADEDLSNLGFESLTVTELTEAINRKFKIQISPAVLYEHRTLQSYAMYLLEQYHNKIQASYQLTNQPKAIEGQDLTNHTLASDIQSKQTQLQQENAGVRIQDVAIVGMDGIFPGSPDLKSFWENLEAERNLLSNIPVERFRWDDYHSSIAANSGGFISDIDKFDPLFFRISPYEAEMMDPQQRLLLQTAWGAIEDAGYCVSKLAGSKIGVFVGVTTFDYASVLTAASKDTEATTVTGVSASAIVNRISYLLDFHGPSEPVDTGCSSSLVAVHRAIRSLQLGECEAALVGGSNLLIDSKPFIACTQASMLSPDGHCKSFDREANGYVRGEGIGVIFIKALTKAIADGDHIYAVIKGSAVNHGGHVVQGMSVPNPNAQASCLIEAYQNADIDASTVTYIEAHGTGTALGDPIEINALKKVFNYDSSRLQSNSKVRYCGIGTVKTNIGHLEAAAGIAGLIKVALAMKHKKIPATINFKTLNPYIDIENSPFYIAQQTQAWTPDLDLPRRAGVSSFGFGGVNAHVVLEEFSQPKKVNRGDTSWQLIPLSARSPEQLQIVVERLTKHLQTLIPKKDSPLLADIAFTLQIGREPMDYRLIVMGDTIRSIVSTLNHYLETGKTSSNVIAGTSTDQNHLAALLASSNEGQTFIESLITKQKWHEIVRLWVEGVTIPWNIIHRGHSRRRVPLPTYPFIKRRCWIEIKKTSNAQLQPQSALLSQSSEKVPVTDVVVREAQSFVIQHEQDTIELDRGLEELETYGRQRLLAVFQTMGVFHSPDEQYSQGDLRTKLGISPSQERLFTELLRILAKQDYIRLHQKTVITTSINYLDTQKLASLAHQSQNILKQLPDLEGFATLLERCLDILPEVLRGDKDGLEAFFPDGKTDLIKTIYKNNELTDYFNRLAKLAVRCIVAERLPSVDGQMKILEVGAGTGSTTESIIAGLQDYKDRLEYTYTDLTVALVNHGRQHFADDFPNMVCQVLNIEAAIESQGFSPHSFDVIIAANVIHATKNIKVTLTNINSLLKPGGILVLYELTQVKDYNTLTFGLTKGWWLFEETKRIKANAPVLSISQWQQELEKTGFYHVTVLGQPSVADEKRNQAIIISEKLSSSTISTDFNIATSSTPSLNQLTPPLKDSEQSITIHERDLSKQIQAYLIRIFSEVLKLQPKDLESKPTFDRLGVDSLINLQVVKRMEQDLGDLPKTLLFEYGSFTSITEFLIEKRLLACEQFLFSGLAQYTHKEHQPSISPASVAVVPQQSKSYADDIAIVGIGGLFPGSPTLEDFWNNLKERRELIAEIPQERFDVSEIYRDLPQAFNHKISKWGSFLKDIATFDPSFFGISPAEAELMDPQQRLFLQVVWKTLEDAGYRPSHFSNMGVFVGVSSFDYFELLQRSGHAGSPHSPSGLSHAVLANRVSFLMNWHGPSEPVDTACSSSLVAVHRAVQAIQSGECEAAIAGGVNLIITPPLYTAYIQAGFLSPNGRCRPFDQSANGFVRGEGVGALLLKPLKQAQKDKDYIYAVIKGTGVNHGGRVPSLTVPNAHAQADLIRQIYEKAEIDPYTVNYIEAHGTGTQLGDPLEINGLKRAFASFKSSLKGAYPSCGIGSVKANVGHLEAAAGITGVIKVLLCMKNKILPGSPNFEVLNPYIEIEESPFYILGKTQAWEALRDEQGHLIPRRAGVSSFGFGGANAHILLEEYNSLGANVYKQETHPLSQFIILSARNEERLQEYIKIFSKFLNNHIQKEKPPFLQDIAYTLQVGREPMAARIALWVKSKAELAELLESVLQDNLETDKVLTFQKSKQLPTFESEQEKQVWIQHMIINHKYEQLVQHWVNSMDIDWETLIPNSLGKRVCLPTYPFSHEQYWLSPQISQEEEAKDEEKWEQLLTKLQQGDISLEEVNRAINLNK